MDGSYLSDYFLFTFFACFGVIQISLSKRFSPRFVLGVTILLLSYVWFFSSKDRNVPTVVEGVQLFIIFGFSAVSSLASTKILNSIISKK
jgi:hypothetical protein